MLAAIIMRQAVIIITLILFSLTGFGQTDLLGKYSQNLNYRTTDGDTLSIVSGGNYSFILKDSGQYISHSRSCTRQFYTAGNWQLNKDTLILNSLKQKTKTPIKRVTESYIPDTPYVLIEIVDKNEKPVFYESAFVYLNGKSKFSTTQADGRLEFNLNCVDSIRLEGLESFFAVRATYIPTNKNANCFKVILNVDRGDYSYDYKSEEKFLVKNNRLYPFKSDIDSFDLGTRVVVIDKSSVYYEKK